MIGQEGRKAFVQAWIEAQNEGTLWLCDRRSRRQVHCQRRTGRGQTRGGSEGDKQVQEQGRPMTSSLKRLVISGFRGIPQSLEFDFCAGGKPKSIRTLCKT